MKKPTTPSIMYQPGTSIMLAGVSFTILADFGPVDVDDTEHDLFILANKSQGCCIFDSKTNNYATSELKEQVDAWLYTFTENMAYLELNERLIRPRTLDLTTLDGHGKYGCLTVHAAPLTLDEFRRHSRLIPNNFWDEADAFWLSTGWGTTAPASIDDRFALTYFPNGSLGNTRIENMHSFHPALVISSLLLLPRATKKPKIDLSKVPTQQLLDELHNRTKN